jgi:DNA-binding NarL/FixJ family response regulator
MKKIKSFNLICHLQDPSIGYILSHIIKQTFPSFSIFSHYKTTSKALTNPSLFIVDNGLPKKQKNLLFDYIKKQTVPLKVLLAIHNNYATFFSQSLPMHIDGIIYKPFNIEELSEVLPNIAHQF